jgi:hypothetical protein
LCGPRFKSDCSRPQTCENENGLTRKSSAPEIDSRQPVGKLVAQCDDQYGETSPVADGPQKRKVLHSRELSVQDTGTVVVLECECPAFDAITGHVGDVPMFLDAALEMIS